MAIAGPLSGVSWDDLRHIEAVERLGSVSAASRELGVATSTVYRRIAALETSLSVRCLTRGGGVTPAAVAMAELARRTGDSLVAISRDANRRQQQVSGTVTISSIDAFAPLLVEPVAALAAAHPQLEINLHISDKGLSLRKREADIGVTAVVRPGSHLVGRRLFSIDFGVYGTAPVVDAADEARWIVLAWPLQSSSEAKWERANVPSGRVAVATPSRRSFLDMLLAGVGLGLVPRRLAALHPRLVEVESYRPKLKDLTRSAWLTTHPELREHARVSFVLEALAEALA